MYAHFYFGSSPKVKPLYRWWDPFLKHWWIECRVTSRTDPHYKAGEIIDVREGSLYLRRRVSRGTNGRLVYEGAPDLSGLPVEGRQVDDNL